jgi:hypothetical protein
VKNKHIIKERNRNIFKNQNVEKNIEKPNIWTKISSLMKKAKLWTEPLASVGVDVRRKK